MNETMTQETKQDDKGKRCYTVKDLQRILGISRGCVYELLKRKEFRWFQTSGGIYRISKKSFDAWLDEPK